jgi:hypothetical protein
MLKASLVCKGLTRDSYRMANIFIAMLKASPVPLALHKILTRDSYSMAIELAYSLTHTLNPTAGISTACGLPP